MDSIKNHRWSVQTQIYKPKISKENHTLTPLEIRCKINQWGKGKSCHPKSQYFSMNYISSNIKGLNVPWKKILLEQKILTRKPHIILLEETKLAKEDLSTLQKECWKLYSYLANLECCTTKIKLILWKNILYELTFSISSTIFITIVVKIKGTTKKICITNIYRPDRKEKRIQMISSIMRILENIPHPFKIIGREFNMILSLSKKKGLRKNYWDAEAFQVTIQKMELVDMHTLNGADT